MLLPPTIYIYNCVVFWGKNPSKVLNYIYKKKKKLSV